MSSIVWLAIVFKLFNFDQIDENPNIWFTVSLAWVERLYFIV